MKKWWFVRHQLSVQQLVQDAVSFCALCKALTISIQWLLKCGPLKHSHIARLIYLREIIYIISHAANSTCVPSCTRLLSFLNVGHNEINSSVPSPHKPILLYAAHIMMLHNSFGPLTLYFCPLLSVVICSCTFFNSKYLSNNLKLIRFSQKQKNTDMSKRKPLGKRLCNTKKVQQSTPTGRLKWSSGRWPYSEHPVNCCAFSLAL